jgi:hypothetical protein
MNLFDMLPAGATTDSADLARGLTRMFETDRIAQGVVASEGADAYGTAHPTELGLVNYPPATTDAAAAGRWDRGVAGDSEIIQSATQSSDLVTRESASASQSVTPVGSSVIAGNDLSCHDLALASLAADWTWADLFLTEEGGLESW